MKIKNQYWPDDFFADQRKQILASWPTGKDVDVYEAFAYHESLPWYKNASRKAIHAQEHNQTYLCPSLGSDTINRHRELLLHMQQHGEAEFLTTYIDSLTRNCRFEMAQKALEKSKNCDHAVLNGFPVVEHGVQGNRVVLESVDLPVLLFGPSPDARLTHEIGLAGGHTGYSGGPLITFFNYTKDVPVEQVIHKFQYINRLMGLYESNGVPMMYCVSGVMPATSPPSLMIACEIIEMLIAAEQGVKHIQLNCWLQGHWAQDLAYIFGFQKLARQYLDRFGFKDVKTTTYSVCPTGRFPVEHDKVYALISWFTMIGVMGNIQLIGSRTIDEAHHIPTLKGSSHSFRNASMIVNMLQSQRVDIENNPAIREERYWMEREVHFILDRVLELGDGDIIVGTSKAVATGELDQPYATSNLVKSKVMGVKDDTGAARFFDFGNLPFDDEIREFHTEKIAKRESVMGKKTDYETVVQDLTAMSEGAILPKATLDSQ
jgi:methylaspartate mutase epsilon subunit